MHYSGITQRQEIPKKNPADLNHLLMIAYFFPPVGGSGALRPLKLAKYLPDFGWRPVVLTVRNPDWYYARDPELLEELPDSVTIHRSFMLRAAWFYRLLNPLRNNRIDNWIRQWVLHPDPQIGWIPFGLAAGLRLVRKYNIRAIYSTSAPLSGHLIAARIKQITGIPWIADFRDEWVENPDISQPSRLHRKFHYGLEKRIVQQADHVIAAAPGFCRMLKKHCADSCRITPLTMGFDPEDFAQPLHAVADGQPDRFTIAFAGIYYGSFRPTGFLDAIETLINDGEIDPGKIRVLFVGANHPGESGFADRYGICGYTGFVSHRRALGIIRTCDALLLLLSRERGDYVIPSKTFEYMASGKTILALVPENGEVASIIRRTGTGRVVDFEDRDALKPVLLQLYEDWKNDGRIIPNPPRRIEKYNQKIITGKLAELLDNLLHRSVEIDDL